MRRRSRLDRVRMLVVYSVDFIYLLVFFGLVGVVQLLQADDVPVVVPIALAVLIVVFYALSTRPFRVAVRGGRAPVGVLAAAGVVVLLIGLFDMYAIAVWLAMLAPFVRRRTIVLVGLAATVVYQTLVALISGFQPLVLFIQVISVAIVVGGILVNLWLWHVAQEAHEGQEAKAGLAVSEARLRFAGDLNHLLGRSLTDIAERTAAAEDLLSRDPEAASREMARIRELTRDSLREVRTAVRDYRALDLDEALASVRAVLEAAEVRCAVSADTRDLAAETRTMLAGVLREGATNVLKHSAATRCAITIGDGVLEMTNDGVSQEAAGEGTGLRGLAQRVTAAGGGLTALTIPDGQFRLRVDYAVAKHGELATTRQAGEAR